MAITATAATAATAITAETAKEVRVVLAARVYLDLDARVMLFSVLSLVKYTFRAVVLLKRGRKLVITTMQRINRGRLVMGVF